MEEIDRTALAAERTAINARLSKATSEQEKAMLNAQFGRRLTQLDERLGTEKPADPPPADPKE